MQTTTTHSARLSFLRGKKSFMAQPADIIRMEAMSNYTRVYFTDQPPLLTAKVLRLYDEILRPYGFIRTHRSHLVNAQYVLEFDRNRFLQMTDCSKAEVSRRKKSEVRKIFLHP
jgi:two-component system, LytTR family, response regulator